MFGPLRQAKALEFVTGYLIELSLSVDNLFVFLLIVSGLMTALIFTAVIYFAARYRHRRGVPRAGECQPVDFAGPVELRLAADPVAVPRNRPRLFAGSIGKVET